MLARQRQSVLVRQRQMAEALRILGPLKYLEDGEHGQQWPTHLCLLYILTLSGLVAWL